MTGNKPKDVSKMCLPQLHMHHRKDGSTHVEIVTPEKVLPGVKGPDSLKSTLDYYSYPAIRHLVPDSTFARRYYAEKIRPALRWFCSVYDVPVPAWLEGNGHYDAMPKEEFEGLFGPGPLHVREYAPMKVTKQPAQPPEQPQE